MIEILRLIRDSEVIVAAQCHSIIDPALHASADAVCTRFVVAEPLYGPAPEKSMVYVVSDRPSTAERSAPLMLVGSQYLVFLHSSGRADSIAAALKLPLGCTFELTDADSALLLVSDYRGEFLNYLFRQEAGFEAQDDPRAVLEAVKAAIGYVHSDGEGRREILRRLQQAGDPAARWIADQAALYVRS